MGSEHTVTDLQEMQKSLILLSKDKVLDLGKRGPLPHGDIIKMLSSPSAVEIFGSTATAVLDKTINVEDMLRKSVVLFLESNSDVKSQLKVLIFGVGALLLFVQDNWCGPAVQENLEWLHSSCNEWGLKEDLRNLLIASLVLDGEAVVSVVRHPEFLVLARAALLTDLPDVQTAVWWKFRCLLIHQQILDEKSPELHDQLINLKDKLFHSEYFKNDEELNILLHLEAAQMHLFYHEVQPSGEALSVALNESGLSISLTGALGKRTRFQQRDLAQLTLDVQSKKPVFTHSTLVHDNMPKDLRLDDEVRLEKITFTNPSLVNTSELSPLQQACILGMLIQTQKSQPKDKLADEELLAYLTCLLSQPQVWTFQMTSLLLRSKIESNHSRTVERSMTQTQVLVDSIDAKSPESWQRFHLIFCSHMSPRWCLEEELANALLSLGCVNSALDVYLRLHCWEQVIACYNHLKLRHKAEEIIRQELEKKETVKLWCLLGDATDDVQCYEKAWNLSNQRSARAQRHWGLHYFHRKQYSEAIPHFQESLLHNSLQTTVWFQLGYSSLQHEDWATAANAYRRCCFLDPENFEAWNNLSKAYVKLGQKNRAWKSLQEALKWDYENWRVWENYLLVSVDCAVMDEVIRAHHRLLDLKEKHVDVEVLEILVKAIEKNVPDCDGIPCGALLEKALQLFGRITAQVTNNWKVWHLYSRLTLAMPNPTPDSEFKALQQLQKAHRFAVSDSSWVNETEICLQILGLSEELANASLAYASKSDSNRQSISILSSAKLSLKSTLTNIKQKRFDLVTGNIESVLLPKYQSLEKLLEEVITALSC